MSATSVFEMAAAQLEAQSEAAEWRLDPVAWVIAQFGAEPDEWQAEALGALGAGRHVAIRSGHGVGKTCFLAWAVLWWLDVHLEAKVPCAAPTEHQLHDHLWPEMQLWLSRSTEGLNERILWKASRIFAKGRERTCFAVLRAAGPDNKPENLAGFHSANLLYVVDEASGVADVNMTVVTGALSTQGAQLILTGNPTRPTGYFAKRFTEDKANWYIRTVSSLDARMASSEWGEGVAEEWGVESDEYRVRVLGLPPRGNAKGFMTPELVEEGQSHNFAPSGQLIIGVDVARYGSDKSVIARRRGAVCYGYSEFSKLGNPQVAAQVLNIIDAEAKVGETVRVFVDDDGVGGGVTDLLRLETKQRDVRLVPGVIVSGVTFGGAGNKWFTTNAGVWWARLRRLLQEHAFGLPKSLKLHTQLTDRTSAVNMKGKTVLESKEHMRDRGTHSPDIADAIVLTLADTTIGSGFLEYWRSRGNQSETLSAIDSNMFLLDNEPDAQVVASETLKAKVGKRCKHFYGIPHPQTGDRVCVNCNLSPGEVVLLESPLPLSPPVTPAPVEVVKPPPKVRPSGRPGSVTNRQHLERVKLSIRRKRGDVTV